MGRSPCCEKEGLKRGPWILEEDQKLKDYIQEHGHGNWRSLPKKADLQRCGKSCILRWTNYLNPDVKRGKFSSHEEQMIIQLHALIGNRWSAIATHLPKRTDNEIKNHWNTHLKKRLAKRGIDPVTHKPVRDISSSEDGQPKDSAKLNHMAQWESARLEAETRLTREATLKSTLQQPEEEEEEEQQQQQPQEEEEEQQQQQQTSSSNSTTASSTSSSSIMAQRLNKMATQAAAKALQLQVLPLNALKSLQGTNSKSIASGSIFGLGSTQGVESPMSTFNSSENSMTVPSGGDDNEDWKVFDDWLDDIAFGINDVESLETGDGPYSILDLVDELADLLSWRADDNLK